MGTDSRRDMIMQFVLGTGPVAKQQVRAHVFASDPGQAAEYVAWDDMHRTFEVEVRLSGTGQIELGGSTWSLSPGEVVLIPAWEPHRLFGDSPAPSDSLVIQFLPEFLGSRTIGGVLWLSFFATPAATRPRASVEHRGSALAVAADIRAEIEQMPFGWEDAVRAGLLKLLLLLARSSPPEPDAASGFVHRQLALQRVMPAVTLVYSEPSRRHTLQEAADACRLGVRHFSTLFKRVMGVTFADFSLSVRLRHAGELLALSDLPVETIAEQSGFADHSHLARSFARAFGSTPTRYRRGPART